MILLPKHIAIIMDGNGRWAKSLGLPRFAGHKKGVDSVRKITQICGEIGIDYLTLFTFSSENWYRPQAEVNALMTLLSNTLKKEIENLNSNNVKFKAIGELSKFPSRVQNEIKRAEELTIQNNGLNLILALNYGGRQDIINSFKEIAFDLVLKKIKIDDICESLITQKLCTHKIPEPDLLIRTGGDFRISNFMLWQLAYTEIYITKKFWPEFNENDLKKAIEEYRTRERRYGQISEQVVNEK